MSNATVNAWIRRSAGREPALEPEAERPIGHLGVRPLGSVGIGRGGTLRYAPPPAPLESVDVSNRIRRAMAIVRTGVVPRGIDPFDE